MVYQQLRSHRLAPIQIAIDAEVHPPHRGQRSGGIAGRCGRAAARGLDEARGRVELAVAHLRDGAHMRILVDANAGLDLGVISPKAFTMMVIMALVTTVVTTPLLTLFYPSAARSIETARTPTEPESALLLCVASALMRPAKKRSRASRSNAPTSRCKKSIYLV